MPEPHSPANTTRSPPFWLLVLVTISGTLAMHVLVPALPAVARDLHASAATVQLAISLYLIGLAVGQLAYGLLADRFGRRPVLFAGLALYCVAGVVAAAAPGIHVLLAARLLQALGGCAGLALGRAIVRDLAGPDAAAQRLAILNLVVSAGPGVAPVLGGVLASWLGWRSIFVLLAVTGVLTLGLAMRLLPETRGASAPRDAATMARDFGRLLSSPAFLGFAVGGALATTTMYAFMAASPFIYAEQLGRPAGELGIYYFLIVLGTTAGNLVANRLVRRVGIPRLLVGAGVVGAAGALALLMVVLSGRATALTVTLPVVLFTIAAGTASPLALTKAVSVNSQAIASAAGLFGFGQMAWGALVTAGAGYAGSPLMSSAVILAGAGVVAVGAFAVGLWSERR